MTKKRPKMTKNDHKWPYLAWNYHYLGNLKKLYIKFPFFSVKMAKNKQKNTKNQEKITKKCQKLPKIATACSILL